MNKITKKISATVLAGVILSSTGFIFNNQLKPEVVSGASVMTSSPYKYEDKVPKYIFMFIGDGMSYAQIQAAGYYQGVVKNGAINVDTKNYPKPENLSFTNFPVVGTVTTYDSTSFAPDSASTGTSLSTGKKTLSNVINMDETKTISYETITEKLKKQLGYKVGVVTSVNLDHATPGAYYAHVPSRSNYYDIGLQLVESDFDYFAGGKFLSDTSKQVKEEGKELIGSLAEKKGYKVVNSREDIRALTKDNEKVIAICPTDDLEISTGAIKYDIDSKTSELTLAEYTKKGIELLENENGFFMMVEGGKIDWASHANDAAATIKDAIAFDNAIKEAVKFYNKYPEDTLILVTGDHETGGLSIGFAGTNYDTYLERLTNQKMSYVEFDKLIDKYRENKTSFEDAMKDVTSNFGLMLSTDTYSANNKGMVLTELEEIRLRNAYDKSIINKSDRKLNQDEYVLYGGYEPFSVTLTHLINNKSGISFTSYSHTGVPVPMFAKGLGQELFNGYYDNTDVFEILKAITKVK